MNVKAKFDEINERCESDEGFRKLFESDLEAALGQCGVSDVDKFVRQVEETGLLSEEEMEGVAGGIADSVYLPGGSSDRSRRYREWLRRNNRRG